MILPSSATPPAATTTANTSSDSSDKQIDRLVYQLYDLSGEEIAMVEEELAVRLKRQHRPRSPPLPLLTRYTCLPEDLSEQVATYIILMWVRDADSRFASRHELVLAA